MHAELLVLNETAQATPDACLVLMQFLMFAYSSDLIAKIVLR